MTHPAQTQQHQGAVAHAADAVSKAQHAQPAESSVNAYEVGWLFVQEYYTFLNKEPQKLYFFYNSKSSFIHGTECESLDTQTGQKEIQNRILELDFHDCKVLVSNVDSQLSHGGCIVIMVLGEMSNKGGASHKFCQCFVLAEQPSGYFVYNDMFRFLKEDIDNEYEDAADPMYENDYLNSINNHAHTNEVVPAVAAAPIPVPTASSISPAPAPTRGRSPSPKKLPTPTPAAAPLNARSPSPKKEPVVAAAAPPAKSPVAPAAVLATSPVPAAKTPSTPAKKEEVDREFVGSWAESVPTPIPAAASASSPTKTSQQKKKTNAKTEAAASSVAPVSAPITPAVAAKPKSWATLVSSNTEASAGSAKPLAAKPSNEGLKQQRPVPATQPIAVKKIPTTQPPPQAAPAASSEEASQNGGGFQEVQRGRGNSGRGQSNGQQRPYQPREDNFARSIFIKLQDGLDESNIRQYFENNAGKVSEVIVPPLKNVAFVVFEDVAVAQAAIGKAVVINGKTITPDVRKKVPYPQNNNNGRPQNQRFSGQQQRPQSSQGAASNAAVKGNAAVAAS
ncbi:UNVERIFIED_CONTAM: hypothetical protein HDU68_002835 [Siphonaria sp. JEL0065]|nr:hypothetical protein HDU68_002835 [Siphonaria sp. JEL0065]